MRTIEPPSIVMWAPSDATTAPPLPPGAAFLRRVVARRDAADDARNIAPPDACGGQRK